jgi:redox-sensing transcriptional repressor
MNSSNEQEKKEGVAFFLHRYTIYVDAVRHMTHYIPCLCERGNDIQANKHAVQRLLRYTNVLHKLKSLGFVKVFSDNLGDALGVSSVLVRKDFSQFGLQGNRRGGYRVDDLIERLDRILGKDQIQKIIIVGCGKMGRALMNYRGFTRERIRIVAGFDADAAQIDPAAPVPILDIGDMPECIRNERIEAAIVTVPESAAPQVIDTLIASGIKGILNFAPIAPKGTSECTIHNINIEQELENLLYFIRFPIQNEEG